MARQVSFCLECGQILSQRDGATSCPACGGGFAYPGLRLSHGQLVANTGSSPVFIQDGRKIVPVPVSGLCPEDWAAFMADLFHGVQLVGNDEADLLEAA